MRSFILLAMATGMLLIASVVQAQTGQEVEKHAAHAGHEHAHDHAAHQQAAKPEALPEQTANAKPAGPHGGTMQQVGQFQIESILEPGGIRVFAYDQQGQPVELKGARGLATVQIEGDAKRYRYDLFPEAGQDNLAKSLAVAVDLSRIAGRKIELTYQLIGVSGAERKPLQFTATGMVPMTEAQQVAAAIAAQKTCPVSGQPLGGMGKPIPVTVGDQTVYVCCAGCIDAVKENPAKYFPQQQVKLTVTKATEADAAAIKEQKLCPVMDEPLGGMGTPLKVTGLGRDVFLCCKGCVKFLEKEPQKYLAKLPPLPNAEKPEVVKATKADAQFVAAQKLCPVMDEPLDAMGGPYRTVVEGRVVYLCCPGCARKLHADPTGYLAKLTRQGVSPPAAK